MENHDIVLTDSRCHDEASDHPNEHANRMIWLVRPFRHTLLCYLQFMVEAGIASHWRQVSPRFDETRRVRVLHISPPSTYPTSPAQLFNENCSTSNLSVFGDVSIDPAGCHVGLTFYFW